MPKKPPPVSLRKPPAAVDLARAEQFVRKAEEPKDAQTPRPPNVKPPERSDVPKSEPSPSPSPSAPRQNVPRSVVARTDGRTLRRMTLYLPDELARKLAVYCARKDLEMSVVVSEAVRVHLAAEPDE